MNESIRQQVDYDDVFRWHAAGITGRDMAIWNMENGKADHGQLTQQRILDAAPDATVITVDLTSNPGTKAVSTTALAIRSRSLSGATASKS